MQTNVGARHKLSSHEYRAVSWGSSGEQKWRYKMGRWQPREQRGPVLQERWVV